MYFEGTRDMYMPLLSMLFMGSEDETKAKAEPRIDKFLPIYDQVIYLMILIECQFCFSTRYLEPHVLN